MSRSLHSSMEYFCSSKRWSRNDRRHRAGEVLDRGDLLEDLLQPGALGYVVAAGLQGVGDPGLPALVAEQPVEALGLQRQEVWDLQRLTDLGERHAAGGRQCAWTSSGSRCARQPRRVLPQACVTVGGRRRTPPRTSTVAPCRRTARTCRSRAGQAGAGRLTMSRGASERGSAKRQHTCGCPEESNCRRVAADVGVNADAPTAVDRAPRSASVREPLVARHAPAVCALRRGPVGEHCPRTRGCRAGSGAVKVIVGIAGRARTDALRAGCPAVAPGAAVCASPRGAQVT